jgi:hypothetical protein
MATLSYWKLEPLPDTDDRVVALVARDKQRVFSAVGAFRDFFSTVLLRSFKSYRLASK